MNVGLFGFGRTGRLVAEEIIKDSECKLKWVVRKSAADNHKNASDFLGFPHKNEGRFFTKDEATEKGFFSEHPVDVIIDFSSPEGIYEYAEAADSGARIVTAISKYGEKELALVKELSGKTAVLHSPNITLGINFLLVVSQILKDIVPQADIEIVEEHFREKREKSGSAMKIASKLGLDPLEHINSIRVGGIVGKHEVVFGLPNQVIRITHETISRAAFGTGAIFAAKKIVTAPPGLYGMEQIMYEEFVKNISVERLV